MVLTIGVLALQGAFVEHTTLLRRAASQHPLYEFTFLEVRTRAEIDKCDALVIPGGESTTLSLVAQRSGLLEPLRQFVKVDRKPTWGTCAGLIVLAEQATATKDGGQALIGGLDVIVHRNYFGRQTESFEAALDLPFLEELHDNIGTPLPSVPFRAMFIRAPVVDELLSHKENPHLCSEDSKLATTYHSTGQTASIMKNSSEVQVLARLDRRTGTEALGKNQDGNIVAVKQRNVFGTSFHPELTNDARVHSWWLLQVIKAYTEIRLGSTPLNDLRRLV